VVRSQFGHCVAGGWDNEVAFTEGVSARSLSHRSSHPILGIS
jgi:hypothetical protein